MDSDYGIALSIYDGALNRQFDDHPHGDFYSTHHDHWLRDGRHASWSEFRFHCQCCDEHNPDACCTCDTTYIGSDIND